jgi:hypothetical protein
MAKKRLRVPRYARQAASTEHQPLKQQPRRILADLSAQAPNNSYDPPTYYEDKEFRCVDCGEKGVWTAEQQKWWYEVAKGSISSTAIRCRACRQQRRAAKEEQRRKSEAGRKLKDSKAID